MIELSLNDIKKYKDSTLVLKDITFQVYAGEKVGIIGANGSGKSTILKLIAGIETLNIYQGSTSRGYDEGWISITKGATTAYLEQIPKFPDGLRVIDILSLAFGEIYSIESEMRELEDKMKNLDGILLEKVLKQYSEIQQLYEVKGGYDIQEKLNKVCKGLKFDEEFLNKDFSILSGGEKTTVILGKILIENPEILLLDEPTNHLDIDTIETLEQALEDFEGTIFFISHDRYFINKISEKVIAIENKCFNTYLGNYDYYKNKKDELNMRIAEEPIGNKEKFKRPRTIGENKEREVEAAKTDTMIETLENEIRELDSAMDTPGLNYEELNKLYCRKDELNKELDLVMDLWLSLNN